MVFNISNEADKGVSGVNRGKNLAVREGMLLLGAHNLGNHKCYCTSCWFNVKIYMMCIEAIGKRGLSAD